MKSLTRGTIVNNTIKTSPVFIFFFRFRIPCVFSMPFSVYSALRKSRSVKLHLPGLNLQHHVTCQFTMNIYDHLSGLIEIQT